MAENPFGEQNQAYQQQPGPQWQGTQGGPPRGGGGGTGAKVGIALVVVAAVAGLGGWAYLGAKNPEIWFINALSVPVEISMGEETISLGAHSYEEHTFSPGAYDITVSADGETITEESVDVPGFTDAVAYNVLGAADLIYQGVVYTTVDTGLNEDTYDFHINETFVVRDDVNYLFEAPPDEISLSSGTTRATHHYFGFVDPEAWGWAISLEVLVGLGRDAEAQTLAETIDRWQGSSDASATLTTLRGGGGYAPAAPSSGSPK